MLGSQYLDHTGKENSSAGSFCCSLGDSECGWCGEREQEQVDTERDGVPARTESETDMSGTTTNGTADSSEWLIASDAKGEEAEEIRSMIDKLRAAGVSEEEIQALLRD